MSNYDELVGKLKEVFQIDKPELDFGIYRIINARAAEINDYLQNKLKAKVTETLTTAGSANLHHLQSELAEAVKNAESLGVAPDSVPKVTDLKKRIVDMQNSTSEHENAVFSHLLTFFSRYFDNGDFISQRRYKGDTYAIPYSGEEVMLHWANKDQYYTKSGENFTNYSFKLDDKRTVHFRLIAADTAKDNRKDNDKERRFVLSQERTVVRTDDEGEEYEEYITPVSEENGELIIRFEYCAMPKGSKQDVLVSDAVKLIFAHEAVKSRWLDLGRREPTEKNPTRTLLEKHLGNYTTRNTADYFIHKDLGRFLRNELDMYIKNDVMHLDDLQNAEKFADIEKNLRMIQCLRAIALDLITFLAQLENFQKKLWLKKKFIISANYCVTLDRVPQELYQEIADNEKLWEQWEQLGMVTRDKSKSGDALILDLDALTGTVDYLKSHQFLMVDTALFGSEFKSRLLNAIDNLDEQVDGVLIHGDNFQALELLQERYRGQVKCTYIDPPYNTGGDGFSYKDNYKHSTWMASIYDRVLNTLPLIKDNGLMFVSIDRDENRNMLPLLFSIFGEENFIEEVVWQKAYGGGSKTKHINNLHEYIHVFSKNKDNVPYMELPPDKEVIKYYKYTDEKVKTRGAYRLQPLNTNSNDFRANLTYPLPIPRKECFGTNAWSSEMQKIRNQLKNDEIKLSGSYESGWDYLMGEQTKWNGDYLPPQRQWQWSWAKTKQALIDNELSIENNNGEWVVNYKQYRYDTNGNERGKKPGSICIGPYTQTGTDILRNFFNFDIAKFPKPVGLIENFVGIDYRDQYCIILDYFAGSGTTAHATISLNRNDQGKRKYILVEQGEYFDTVTKPRVQKVVYSSDWKEGKPTAPNTGISHAFKVIKLESYEDTLNNLELRRTATQQDLLSKLPESARQDYLLRYMLDMESTGSILSTDNFKKPFNFKLKVAIDSAGAVQERQVDLVETFNYLIGLRVKSINAQYEKGRVVVEGTMPNGEKALILWRDCDTIGYEELNAYCESRNINPRDSEFDVVYINGDHNIPNVLQTTVSEGGITKTLKLRQIEPEFLSRMFGEVV